MSLQKAKIVRIKGSADISHKLLHDLGKKVKPYGFSKTIPFESKTIIVADWVHQKCLYGCRRYNTNWCCPPATPKPDSVKKIVQEDSLVLLLVDEQSCAEFYRDNEAKRIKQIQHWKGAVSVERLLFLEGYYKAFSVIGANCVLCKQCAYPRNCLFPQEKRPSVESYSIDMIGTLQKIGVPSQIAKNKTEPFNSYSIVLVH